MTTIYVVTIGALPVKAFTDESAAEVYARENCVRYTEILETRFDDYGAGSREVSFRAADTGRWNKSGMRVKAVELY